MTNKEKIAYLKKYQMLMREIDQVSEELRRWQEIATRISPQYSSMPHATDPGDKLQTAAIETSELSESLNRKIHQAIAKQSEIMQLLSTLNDDTLRQLMTYRYIQGKKWEEIALKMNFDYRWVLRLHGRALNQLSFQTIESHIEKMI